MTSSFTRPLRTMLLPLAALTCALQLAAATYNFSTVAGVGARAGSDKGNGGGAELPLFYRPTGIAINGAGNLYVTDAGYGLIRVVTPAGTVTTLAGTPGLTGGVDGTGTESNVSFNSPQGPAVDSAGNIYVADFNGHTIRKITPAGVVTTLAGTAGSPGTSDGTGSAARFQNPTALAVDSSGNVYVTDTGNKTIRKITSAGVVTTLAGTVGVGGSADGTGTAARFEYPRGLAIDKSGNLYVGDCNNNTIRKVTSAGVVTTLAGSPVTFGSADGTGSAARFNFPNGLAIDANDNLYVADELNQTIRKVTPAGVVTTLAGSAGNPGRADGTGSAALFNFPTAVAVDGSGNVYVTDYDNVLIRKITPAGVVSTIAGAGGINGLLDGSGYAMNPALFRNPADVAVRGDGTVLVLDTGNNCVRSISTAGDVTVFAGNPTGVGRTDGVGTAANFRTPTGMTIDGAGTLYIADSANHLIRKVASDGTVSTLAGTPGSSGTADGTGTAAGFNYPSDLAVDSGGNLYVTDYNNHTIRKVTPAGVVTTVAGSVGLSGSTDGNGSSARFNYPNSIAIDAAGNLYVSDLGNHTIRKITPGGTVSTLAGSAGQTGSTDGTGSAARFDAPNGITIDSSGNAFVSDGNTGTIRMITPAGAVTTIGGTSGVIGSRDGAGTAARFNHPAGITVTAGGDLYIADSLNHTVRRGSTSSSGGSGGGGSGGGGSGGGGSGGGGSGGSSSGTAGSNSAGGSTGNIPSSPSTTAGKGYLLNPGGIVVSSLGEFYVADTANNCIKKISSAGVVTVFAGKEGTSGSADGNGTAATFNSPSGLVFDSDGNLYVADTGNAVIRKITTSGDVSTLAGTAGSRGTTDGTGSAARFTKPVGLVYSSLNASLFVTDASNNTVRRVTTSGGAVTTFAGAANQVGDDDGVMGAARFNSPTGIAIDGSFNLFVADSFNHTIRSITTYRAILAKAEGTITTAGNAKVIVTDPALTGSPITVSVSVNADAVSSVWASSVASALAGNTTISSRYSCTASGVYVVLRLLNPEDQNVGNVGLFNDTCAGIVENATSTSTVQSGTVSTVAGSAGLNGLYDGSGAYALFNMPQGLSYDGSSALYVADTGNSCIRRVSIATGSTLTIAGMAGISGYRDGASASALFNQPQSVLAYGSVVVADTGNSVIRSVNLSTDTVRTIALSGSTSSGGSGGGSSGGGSSGGSSGGGGGGAPSVWFLGTLAALAATRFLRSRRQAA